MKVPKADLKKISKTPARRSVTRRHHSHKAIEENKDNVPKPDDEKNLKFPLNPPSEDPFGAISCPIEPWRQEIWERLPAEKKLLAFPCYEPYSFTCKISKIYLTID